MTAAGVRIHPPALALSPHWSRGQGRWFKQGNGHKPGELGPAGSFRTAEIINFAKPDARDDLLGAINR
jgi:hypothetical protein